jgi:hypothetical protein
MCRDLLTKSGKFSAKSSKPTKMSDLPELESFLNAAITKSWFPRRPADRAIINVFAFS